jgi:hypothetical protein
MTRDNLSYPWTQPNIDLCHCHLLPTYRLPAHRQKRRGEAQRTRPFVAAIACRHAV